MYDSVEQLSGPGWLFRAAGGLKPPGVWGGELDRVLQEAANRETGRPCAELNKEGHEPYLEGK